MSLENCFENWFDKIKTFINMLKNAFNELVSKIEGLFLRSEINVDDYGWVFNNLRFVRTNYKCDKCGGVLSRSMKYYDDIIIFECVECGKVHKAYKNNLLGRFKIN